MDKIDKKEGNQKLRWEESKRHSHYYFFKGYHYSYESLYKLKFT